MKINLDDSKLANPSIEFQILGAIMSDNGILDHIPFLLEDHFATPAHQRIFSGIQAFVKQGKPANALTLRVHFADDPDLSAVGGAGGYLTGAMVDSIHVHDPVYFAKYIVELAQRRALQDACAEAADQLEVLDAGPPAEIALKLAQRFEEVARGFNGPCFSNGRDVADMILEKLKKPPTQATSTGMKRLDTAMGGGLYAGKAYGFAARKKCGKTILCSTISTNLDLAGVKHLFICGEMGQEEIEERALARLTNSYSSAFRTDYGRSVEFMRKVADVVVTQRNNVLYHDAPGITFDELRRSVISAIMHHRIKGFILDYWQLVGGKEKAKSDAAHLDEVAQWIANTCRKYKVWAIVMGQINQEGNTRGGEGMRLAFDQVYHLQPCGPGDFGDITKPERWLEMMDTRYTRWMSIGDKLIPGIVLEEKGPYFEEVPA